MSGDLWRRGGMVVVALALSACAGTPPRPTQGGGTPTTSAGAPRATPPARTAGGGAFYKDDGPGDNPPPDLARVPDASPRAEALHAYANRPYRVMGQNFVPRKRVEAFRQRGVASWYGRRFHGLPTSSGEAYDMYAMTAAHPTLPIPSYARVTHLASGRSVVVRVNDRGPFLHGRVMDLSYTAAWKLGYVNNGSAEVEVEQILPGEGVNKPPPLPDPAPVAQAAAVTAPVRGVASEDDSDPLAALIAEVVAANDAPTASAGVEAVARANEQRVFLQLGVFATRDNAENLRAQVAAQMTELGGRLEIAAEGGRFKVYGGPFDSLANARAVAEQIGEQLGIRPFAVQRKEP
ncbi:lipoprotein [Betaproteobacteria bacterium]|nr:lipoprotein [Betaproteobacteria bacterium]